MRKFQVIVDSAYVELRKQLHIMFNIYVAMLISVFIVDQVQMDTVDEEFDE